MKKRFMSLLLVLVMVLSLMPTFAAAADENGTITNPAEATGANDNLNLTKTLAPGANGTYDITMESWATGEVKTQGITEKIPTDFVVVVDQSGSMDTTDMPTGDPTVQNNKYLEDVAAGRYYYKDGDNYYRVYGVKDYLFHYYPANYWYVGDILDRVGADVSWFQSNTEQSFNYDNQFYWKEGNAYRPIKLTIAGKLGTYYNFFSYVNGAGETVRFNRDSTQYGQIIYHNLLGEFGWGETIDPDERGYSTIDGMVRGAYNDKYAYTYSEVKLIKKFHTGMHVNYPMYDRKVGYTKLCYRDVNGVEYEVPSNNNGGQSKWEYCQVSGDQVQAITTFDGSTRPTYSGLYTFSGTTDRMTALKAALNEFAGAVANETDDFGAVDNRISIVGFSSPNYSNTELLTHTERDISSGSTNGWQKDTCDNNVSEYYGKGLVAPTDGNVGTVNPKITNAINAITHNGGTQPEDGLNMAYQVLTNRSNTTYTIRSGEREGQTIDRNTIVIFFTDGQPGDHHYSNQYSEANDVVEQALAIKSYKDTSLFSIGVFGESDGNPLTYDARNDKAYNNKGQEVQVKNLDTKDWQYLGGWMETYTYGGTTYCLRRQWRPSNADYTDEPNDTIYDYMSVVSSNYPDAENFIAPAWLSGTFSGNYIAATDGDTVRHKSTAEATNKYYRMASSQDTLVAAFMQAVTMNNEETTTDTSVALTDTAIFKDKVNTADFDTTGATYTVQWQPVKEENGQLVNNGNAETKVNGAAYPAEGINYSGFNYSANFVTSAHPGQKLVITINGLTPKKTVGELKSNDGNAGVYGPEDEDPTVSITSPTLQFPESAAKTYLIDYNAKMTVAAETTKLVGATNDTVTGTNGSFVKSGTNVTYQLSSGNQADKTAEINKAYTGVDTATVYGKLVNVENAKVGWNQITTVPASSVYYDDDLAKDTTPAVTVGDGSGKITGVNDANVSMNAANVTGTFYFTFYGTGIDVYCTTHDDASYVSATVFKGEGAAACVKANRQGSAKTIRSYSAGDYYNTPSVFFDGLPADTYTLKIMANDNAKFKLDGVRVYNPVKAGTEAATELNKTDEGNATYLNLRKVLLNDDDGKGVFTVTNNIPTGDIEPSAVSGVLFINDADNVVTMSHYRNVYNETTKTWETEKDESGNPIWYEEEAPIYQSQFDVYKANGPKNEIYLNGQQEIVFQIDTKKVPADTKVWIGLSAPTKDESIRAVSITGKNGEVSVNSVMDMYYDFTVPANGQVTIKNLADKDSGNIISVTNLKITGITGLIPMATGENQDAIDRATKAVFMPMTIKSIRMAANDGVDPEEVVTPVEPDPEPTDAPDPEPTDTPDPEPTDTPDPEPTPDTPDEPDDPKPGWNDNSITAILQNLFRNLLQSLSGLFGGLGNW